MKIAFQAFDFPPPVPWGQADGFIEQMVARCSAAKRRRAWRWSRQPTHFHGLPRRHHVQIDAGGPGPLIRAAPASQGRKVKKGANERKGAGSTWPAPRPSVPVPVQGVRLAKKRRGRGRDPAPSGWQEGSAPVKEMRVNYLFFVS